MPVVHRVGLKGATCIQPLKFEKVMGDNPWRQAHGAKETYDESRFDRRSLAVGGTYAEG